MLPSDFDPLRPISYDRLDFTPADHAYCHSLIIQECSRLEKAQAKLYKKFMAYHDQYGKKDGRYPHYAIMSIALEHNDFGPRNLLKEIDVIDYNLIRAQIVHDLLNKSKQYIDNGYSYLYRVNLPLRSKYWINEDDFEDLIGSRFKNDDTDGRAIFAHKNKIDPNFNHKVMYYYVWFKSKEEAMVAKLRGLLL